MGPTNIALVKLFQADKALREAQENLDSASRSVRLLERRVGDLTEKVKAGQQQLRERQAKAGQLELDIKMRDERIERLRTQQQEAKNHKEYQAFLTEINTEKVDKAKGEEEALKVMEVVEKQQAEVKDLQAQLEGEQKKFEETKQQLGGRLATLQVEVDKLGPARAEAAAAVPARARDLFERMAEHMDGDAMAPLNKPSKRHEEYICDGCNMSLVADVYNRLHSRDEPVQCPNCRRILFIPQELPPELAIHKPKERKELKREKAGGIPAVRQLSAADVMRSITVEEDEETPAPPAEERGNS